MNTTPTHMGFPPEVFARRRRAIQDALGQAVMVLPSATVTHRSRDTEHRYRPDSELFYATGVTQPDSVAVVVGGTEPRWILFVPERDPEVELWSGSRVGPEDAGTLYGADDTQPISQLDELLPAILQEGRRVFFRLGRGGMPEHLVLDSLAAARARGPRRGTGPRAIVDPGEILDDLRLVKDEHEIAHLRAAAWITMEGHRAAFGAAAPGVGEWVVEAAVESTFREAGASGPGFPTIVGSGANACILHYVDNHHTLEAGDLVLVDAGAERELYSGDVTRTFPTSGRFSPEQRDVYEVVEAARVAALGAAAPGVSMSDVHGRAVRVITEGLVALGVLTGNVETLVEEEAYKPFYPHQTSHWLGLDVHDPGDYARDGVSRALEPGMAFTVEPGLYLRPGAIGVPPRLAGIGVRIEDDVVVTSDGCMNLTESLPTSAAAMEEMCGGAT
ncbi:MAG: aminopeptidase P N-terminal domain-containing protein [Gemmatimonadota bacterium]|nr:aminopeptidase P N-terminal domain-containing protein [Gemmatimonadota bacterium]